MIYLKEFRIPKDSWTDCYFGCSSKAGCPSDLPQNMPLVCQNSHLNTWYPWNTLYNRGRHEFSFEDITILYGSNGSGKTTLLNVIAQKLQLNWLTRYNKSTSFDDYVSVCSYDATDLNAERCIQRGRILVSDDVFDAMLKKGIDQRRKELELKNIYDEFPRLDTPGPEVRWPQYVMANLQRNTKEQLNGETAFEFFIDAIKDDSLVLLDEPENSLSAKWQMKLVKYITGAVRAFRCQFIIATHSPFILSIPGARIYNLDSMPIGVGRWYNLENYQLFKDNERFFECD